MPGISDRERSGTPRPKGRRISANSTHLCSICNQYYSRRDNLRVHQRVHSGEMPFECRYCGQRFRWMGAFRIHESNHVRDGHSVPEARRGASSDRPSGRSGGRSSGLSSGRSSGLSSGRSSDLSSGRPPSGRSNGPSSGRTSGRSSDRSNGRTSRTNQSPTTSSTSVGGGRNSVSRAEGHSVGSSRAEKEEYSWSWQELGDVPMYREFTMLPPSLAPAGKRQPHIGAVLYEPWLRGDEEEFWCVLW